ncbi:MAG: outer membrane beta-barrel protein [Burkholderiales bacterium]|nr:outer membrane beta-barrel protein [Burkholderiales bacterium]
MKKILLATLITSATFFSVSAQAEGGYVGLAFDKANYSVSVVGATTNSSDDKPTGFKIYGGWNYNANFAVEAGYADFGSAKVNFSTNAGNGSAEAKVNAFYLAGKGTMPINEQFSAFGKLGVVRNKSDYSGRGFGAVSLGARFSF